MSSETHRTRNRRGEGSRLRGEIIAAATALLERAGSEDAITLRGVARQAGVSAPSIYAHFADREEIIGAVVAQAFTELEEALVTAVEGENDPARRLWKLCEAYLDFAESKPHRYRVAFGRHSTADPTTTGSSTRLEDLSGGRAFTRLIDAVAGYTKNDRSPQVAATALWVALHGYASLTASVPLFPWPDRREMLSTLLASIAPAS